MRESRDTDGVTLDLSIKKPRENNLQPSKIQQHPISSQNTVFRVAQPPDQQGFFHQVCYVMFYSYYSIYRTKIKTHLNYSDETV